MSLLNAHCLSCFRSRRLDHAIGNCTAQRANVESAFDLGTDGRFLCRVALGCAFLLLSLTASASGASMEVGATLPISRDARRK